MYISFLPGDLPPATLTSFFTDATWDYPGGVWYSSLINVTARPATKPPVTALLLTGSSLHGVPLMEQNRPIPHVQQPLLHLVRRPRASQALYGL